MDAMQKSYASIVSSSFYGALREKDATKAEETKKAESKDVRDAK